MGNDDIEALNYDNLEAVAQLQGSSRYKTIIEVTTIPVCFCVLSLPQQQQVSVECTVAAHLFQ
jgi:hypothetical protein